MLEHHNSNKFQQPCFLRLVSTPSVEQGTLTMFNILQMFRIPHQCTACPMLINNISLGASLLVRQYT